MFDNFFIYNNSRIHYIYQVRSMDGLKLTHIVMAIILAFLYIYFIIFLNHIYWLSFLLIGIFIFFFVLYSLSLYSLFHKGPGYESYKTTGGDMDVEKIGEHKQNGRRMHEILVKMREDVTYEELKGLKNEYLDRYQHPSFCQSCEIIKNPRTYHCSQCSKCIIRRQKHSDLIGMCIGQRNMKVFMQHLFISMFLSLFMTVSLILITVLEHHKLKDFSDLQFILFAMMEMSMGAAVLLFGKQFFISYYNAVENITETERNIGIITSNNNPFSGQNYYGDLFKSRIEYLKLEDIADPSHWLQLHEEH